MNKTNVKRSDIIDIASPALSPARPTSRRASCTAPPAAPASVTTRKLERSLSAISLPLMLVRDEDATVDQMISATGWLRHTTRAALTGLRKAGYAIDSDKIDGARTHRAVAPK